MATVERSEHLPPCTRCGGRLMMSGVAPQTDQHGQPIHLELCYSCDTGNLDRPAAGLFLQFFANGGGQEPERIQEAGHLLKEWVEECMAAHGWHPVDTPPNQP